MTSISQKSNQPTNLTKNSPKYPKKTTEPKNIQKHQINAYIDMPFLLLFLCRKQLYTAFFDPQVPFSFPAEHADGDLGDYPGRALGLRLDLVSLGGVGESPAGVGGGRCCFVWPRPEELLFLFNVFFFKKYKYSTLENG